MAVDTGVKGLDLCLKPKGPEPAGVLCETVLVKQDRCIG